MLRRFEPHVPGLIYAGLLALVAVAAMNNQNNLLFWVFGVMLAALLISAFVSMRMMWSLRVRRVDPQHGQVDQPLVVRYAITNRGRLLPAFNLHIRERLPRGQRFDQADWRRIMKPAEAWVMHVAPRETVHGETVFWPTRRGQIALAAIQVNTTFPFGIIRKSITVSQPQHTLVYPRVYSLKRGVLASINMNGLLGAKVSAHAGAGDDYFGLREYRSGDSMRHIAWKRSARTDELVTIERASPSPSKLRVILDLTTPTEKLQIADANQARETEENAISLAASLLNAAHLEGYEIGLTVMGSEVLPIALRRNQWHLNKMMAALASIDLDATRLAAGPGHVRDAERAGIVVIAPDRITPLPGHEHALYLTARHMSSLVSEPEQIKHETRPAPRRDVLQPEVAA